jgi:NDP-sugar pyrophosphorylase family protein
MKAMVLAAGLGTRLRPLTNDRPKALVELNGRTLLEITLSRLRQFGVRDVVVNAHHFSELLVQYLAAKNNFGMNIEVSREEVLLDTGGGLKKAAHVFLRNGGGSEDEPFILHNVDVISTIDLARMMSFHREHGALATLAVQERTTSRYLLFDETGQLCGRRALDGRTEQVRAGSNPQALAFCGVHVISPRFLKLMSEEGVFSILTPYLRLAGVGEQILAFRADKYYWKDLGKPENLGEAAQDVKCGRVLV